VNSISKRRSGFEGLRGEAGLRLVVDVAFEHVGVAENSSATSSMSRVRTTVASRARQLGEVLEPVLGARGHDVVAIPQVEVETRLDLFRRGELQQLPRIAKAEAFTR